jgi:hypothetical protein
MAVQTGRTVNKWVQFHTGTATQTAVRWLPVNSISVLGHVYDDVDLTAWMDAVKGSLPNMPDAPIDIAGPWDTTADSANDTAMSGSHTILNAIMAAQVTTVTPLTLDVRIGMRHTWETGEPQFGLTATATSGYWLKDYTFDPSTGMYQASYRLFPGSSLPAFGTSEETT